MGKKFKYIIDDSYVTILFSAKEGGAKTLHKGDTLFETAKSLLEDRSIFQRVYQFMLKRINSKEFTNLPNKLEKMDFIRTAINDFMEMSAEFKFDIQNISSYYKCNGYDSKRVRNVIIDNIYKCHHNQRTIDDIQEEIYENEFEYMKILFDKTSLIHKAFKGTKISIREGFLYYEEERLPEDCLLVRHVIKSLMLGIKSNTYLNFLDRVMANEKKEIREELFLFLEKGNFPIHEDGTFSAYKKIRTDRRDFYTGDINHIEGKMLPRLSKDDVDFDRHNTCSKGYHFCAFEYLGNYRGDSEYILIEVIIDPADVLAIPSDYNNAKGRAFTYMIGKDLDKVSRSIEQHSDHFSKRMDVSDVDDEEEDEDINDEELDDADIEDDEEDEEYDNEEDDEFYDDED